ncbi:MAG: hypothetical protein K0S67_1736 [Nitrososphaeraceae archaeon]|nr:hypothetical protein [Nitrososphaeraceae archaeon]
MLLLGLLTETRAYRQGIEEVKVVAELSSQKTRPATDTKYM